MTPSARNGVWRSLHLVSWMLLLTAATTFAQGTSTFNGRISDPDAAVLPGVTVTVTNEATGVVRTAVTNSEGVYFMPGLEPGVYNVSTDLPGFASAARERVTLAVNSTLTIDFRLGLAGVAETVTVTGEVPLIEATQSKVSATIEATELQNLPMIERTISSMLELLPGAAPVAVLHRTKTNVGTVSFGGSSGENVTPTVDGADNRDSHYGGPLMSFTTEGLDQFQLATAQFTAADGRSNGAAVTIVTKSGTNTLHGSVFGYLRDEAMTAKDYFTKRSGTAEVPFSRQQFGGSFGGPLLRNRVFYFGAIEQMLEDTGTSVPDSEFNQLERLVAAERAGQLPRGSVNLNHPRFGPGGGELRMYSIKANAQLNNDHSLMFRYAGQHDVRNNVSFSTNNDLGVQEDSIIDAWSGVVQHGWVLGNRGLNQITGQTNHMVWFSDSFSNITGGHYLKDFPAVDIYTPNLTFPSVNVSQGSGGSKSDRWVLQLKDDVSLSLGTHTLKFGANYNRLIDLGVISGSQHMVSLAFFDDPSVIMSNSNGRYPQGFQTPGIVRTWTQANGGAVKGVGYLQDTTYTAQQISAWYQDDWRASSKLTLNLGVRYDRDFNLIDEDNNPINATRLILEAIGSPKGALPKPSTKNISPRVGFAYDLGGDGRRVIRAGWGLYFGQYNSSAAAGDIAGQSRRPLNAAATLTNTAVGVGQLATFRYGIDPLPPAPTAGDRLSPNAQGQWLDPNYTDPRTHQTHIGYAHALAENAVLSIDYTHVEGRKELRQLNLNPIVNGTRVMAPDFIRVYGAANILSTVSLRSSINKSRYDALTFRFQRRFPRATMQAHYTLAGAYSYGGSTGNRSGAGLAQDAFDPFAKGEWGPNGPDERHRFVATGVFEMPWGVQLSPSVQLASARPFNLTAGSDLNRDGTNNDRWINPATGQQVSFNAARGDNTTVIDLRSTKFVDLGGERKVGVFVELFNLLDTVNFGGSYSGNGASANFREATGYVPGIGYPRQVQVGARFLF